MVASAGTVSVTGPQLFYYIIGFYVSHRKYTQKDVTHTVLVHINYDLSCFSSTINHNLRGSCL